jgi:hypothetical protein
VAGTRRDVREQLDCGLGAQWACAGAIEKDPHAQRLGALRGHQAHLSADVIDVIEPLDLRFVKCGALLKACNPLLNRSQKPRTDFEAFLDAALEGHAMHLAVEKNRRTERFLVFQLKISRLLPILTRRRESPPDHVWPDFGNPLSENWTVSGNHQSVIGCRLLSSVSTKV